MISEQKNTRAINKGSLNYLYNYKDWNQNNGFLERVRTAF